MQTTSAHSSNPHQPPPHPTTGRPRPGGPPLSNHLRRVDISVAMETSFRNTVIQSAHLAFWLICQNSFIRRVHHAVVVKNK